jgi:hypothetical protein
MSRSESFTKTAWTETYAGFRNQPGSNAMRIGYAVAVAAFLAGTPVMAQQVVIGAPDNGAARSHQYQADQDRSAGHQNMEAAHQEAAQGNYGAAARDQQAAHEDWHAAHHQEHDATRDASGGVVIMPGH